MPLTILYLTTARPIDDVLRDVRETLERYNFVASQLGQRRQRLLIKEPEIKKCLDSVNLLITQRESGAESVCSLYRVQR